MMHSLSPLRRCIVNFEWKNEERRCLYIGIGFHRGVEAEEMESTIRRFLEELEIEQKEIKGLCTVDFKKTDELQEVSAKFGIPLFCFSRDEINSVNVQSKSAAMEAHNIKDVAEPCAILGANRNGRNNTRRGEYWEKRQRSDKKSYYEIPI